MIIRRINTVLRRRLRLNRFAQAGLIVLIWCAGEGLSRAAGLPVPGGVTGMMLALALLLAGLVRPASMRRGARWFIGDMLLFFVPAVMAILDHREFLGLTGLKIIAVILGGTLLVMFATALAVDCGYRMMRGREARRHELAA